MPFPRQSCRRERKGVKKPKMEKTAGKDVKKKLTIGGKSSFLPIFRYLKRYHRRTPGTNFNLSRTSRKVYPGLVIKIL